MKTGMNRNRIHGKAFRLIVLLALLVGLLCGSVDAAPAIMRVAAGIQAGTTRVASPVLTKSKKKKNKKNKNNNNNNGSTVSNSSGSNNGSQGSTQNTDEDSKVTVEEDGTYTSKEEVAAYLNLFGHLPDNYITKKEAKKLGWVSSEGNLDEVAPGKSIGGDYFGNYEEVLPVKNDVEYHECDIDYTGGRRNAKRIIYSSDGYIYYTEDHYTTFEQLYPEE